MNKRPNTLTASRKIIRILLPLQPCPTQNPISTLSLFSSRGGCFLQSSRFSGNRTIRQVLTPKWPGPHRTRTYPVFLRGWNAFAVKDTRRHIWEELCEIHRRGQSSNASYRACHLMLGKGNWRAGRRMGTRTSCSAIERYRKEWSGCCTCYPGCHWA